MTISLLVMMLAAKGVGPAYRRTPESGLRHYFYEASETVAGGPVHGYRTEFDLQNSGRAVYAIIRKSSVLDGNWKAVEPDSACRAAMHGDEASLARVKLSPLSADAAKTLGESFLAICAPAGIFFPLTDILNVVLIRGPHFRATELRTVGQSLSFAGFAAAFDRTGVAIKENSPGGEISLASLDARRAVLNWKPALADLEIVEKTNMPAITLKGTEHFAFRVEVDRRTGMLERAAAIFDDLDMKVVAAPDSLPHVRITRTVKIEPR
jgi:hypothetical protein